MAAQRLLADKQPLDYICVEQGIYGMQMCVGAGLGALLAVLWPGLPIG